MYAKPGDWLIVEITGTDNTARRAHVLEVNSPDGTPPYRVRWLDTDRESLVFPGDDTHVMTQDQLTAHDARMAGRAAALQRHVAQRRGTS
jgi:uncharacterized protein DUF1918